uniref:Echinoderm microtubule-associated protein-like 3 n=1 Tax=Sinocyclocheilus rhinocerous TaxID=307959 RepID=A0A673ISX6_9TELE
MTAFNKSLTLSRPVFPNRGAVCREQGCRVKKKFLNNIKNICMTLYSAVLPCYDVSAESSTEFPDRLSLMEVRLQAQEDEITLLKSSLADALRKLHLHDQQIPLLKQQLIAGKRFVKGIMGKDQTWSSIVEESIQPTTIRTLQQQQSKSSEDSQGSCPQTPTSSSPAPPKEPASSPHGGPLSSIREGEKMLCLTNPNCSTRCNCKHQSHLHFHIFMCILPFILLTGQSIKMFIRGRPITMYIPSNILNYEELRMDLPSQKLDLDWVYGYRGRDCRANLYLLPSGEAVYFIACVVVLYHISNQTQRHYQKHTDCVRCLAIHPDKVRVASGQTAGVDKDGKPLQPFVHIWDSKTLVTLQQIGLGTFERGVGAVAFSSSDAGTFLCVIDDSNEHMLSVWDWNKNIKHTEVKSTNEAVLAVDFSPTDTNNIISCGKSHVYFWTMSAGTLTKKQGIFGKYKKPKFVLCFVFSLTGDVLTGDSEGNILTWGKSAADIKTLGKGAKETFQIMKQTRAHEGSVFTMCILQGGAILSGGGKDRKIIHWSADLAPERECEIPEKFGAVRTIADVDGEELLVGTTRNAILRGTFSDGFVAIVQGHVDEMWGLATHPTQNIFLTCGNDRQVCVWNAEDHKLDWCTTLEESGLCADFSPNGAVVSVGLSTGRWVVLDLQTKEVVSDLTDGNEQLSVMRYSPDGSFLAVGSHDNFIYIYNVTEGGRRYTRFGKCTGHSSFITHLDWSKDGKYVMSNSGDYEILYWDVASGCKLLRNRFESKDREWASYTCVLGFHVMGVWLEGSDGTDINALCRSHSKSMVAVADDFCKVHLFQYPCPKPKAPSYKYEGHGSHVTNVRFTHNDSHLLSMGGKDTCILQWRVKGAGTGDHKEHLASSSSVFSSSICFSRDNISYLPLSGCPRLQRHIHFRISMSFTHIIYFCIISSCGISHLRYFLLYSLFIRAVT